MDLKKCAVKTLDVGDRFVSIGEILGSLDGVRRELALRVMGRAGAFTGFTTLRIDESALTLPDAKTITVSVAAIDIHGVAVVMEFDATICGMVGETYPVVVGRGPTVCPPVPRVEPPAISEVHVHVLAGVGA